MIASNNRSNTLQNTEMWGHLMFSFILLYILNYTGQATKFVIAPYVFYLVYTRKLIFLPALIIIMSSTTIISVFVFFSSVIVALMHYSEIKKSPLYRCFLIMIIILPVILYSMALKLTSPDYIFAIAINSYSFYFGVFPLFYGFILAKGFHIRDFNLILLPLIIAFILRFAGITFNMESHRILSLLYIIFLTIFMLLMIAPKSIKELPSYIKVFSVLFTIGIFLNQGIKFHILFSVFIAFIIIYFKWKKWKLMSLFSSGIGLVIFAMGFIFFAINYSQTYGSDFLITEIDYTDIINYPEYMMQKLFGDRGVIWAGAWEVIKNEVGFFPPIDNISISFIAQSGAFIEGVDYGAHNLFLELLLRLGFAGGIVVIFVLIESVIILSRYLRLSNEKQYLFYTAIVIGLLIGGGLTGQYLMLPNFSFLTMTLSGLLIGYGYYNYDFNQQA